MISTLTRWATSATLAVLAPLTLAHSPALAADGEQPPTLTELARATGAAPTAPSVRAAAVTSTDELDQFNRAVSALSAQAQGPVVRAPESGATEATSPFSRTDPQNDCVRDDGTTPAGARCDIRSFQAVNTAGALTVTSNLADKPAFANNGGVAWFVDDPATTTVGDYSVILLKFNDVLHTAVARESDNVMVCATVRGTGTMPRIVVSNGGRTLSQRIPKRCLVG